MSFKICQAKERLGKSLLSGFWLGEEAILDAQNTHQ
jgi:hypothetical protein